MFDSASRESSRGFGAIANGSGGDRDRGRSHWFIALVGLGPLQRVSGRSRTGLGAIANEDVRTVFFTHHFS